MALERLSSANRKKPHGWPADQVFAGHSAFQGLPWVDILRNEFINKPLSRYSFMEPLLIVIIVKSVSRQREIDEANQQNLSKV